MRKKLKFLQKERLYILLLIFVLLFNAIMLLKDKAETNAKKEKPASSQMFASHRGEMEEILHKNERLLILFSLASLLIFAVILLGIVIDMIIASVILRKRFNIRTIRPPPARWKIWDVCKVVILFLFFGYIIIISEASLSRAFPVFKIENIRMMINSSILDILVVVFILYFTTVEHKEKIKALGLSGKNLLKNIFYGIVGYIALIPVLILILAVTAVIINITKYVPERQPVVELFLKEKDVAFLTYSSLFAAIVGPMIEELFFRGFLYGACKKYVGIFWSIVITAGIFAALHSHPVGFAPIMALGILLAYLYEKTGTLVSSITVHMIHNLSMVFLVFLIKQVGII